MAYNVTTHSPKGWPLLVGQDYIKTIPAYTQELAQKLDTGDASAAAIINAASQAEDAAQRAINAANSADTQAILEAQGLIATANTPVVAGQKPPTGTPLRRLMFSSTASTTNNAGGIYYTFPEQFRGITGILWSMHVRNAYATFWDCGTGGLYLTVYQYGSPAGTGQKMTASIQVEGW